MGAKLRINFNPVGAALHFPHQWIRIFKTLPDGFKDSVCGHIKTLASATQAPGLNAGTLEAHSPHSPGIVQQHLLRLRPFVQTHLIGQCNVLLMVGGGHHLQTPAIHNIHIRRPQPLHLHRDINGGIAAADHNTARRQRQLT